jgi:hypothetical protein
MHQHHEIKVIEFINTGEAEAAFATCAISNAATRTPDATTTEKDRKNTHDESTRASTKVPRDGPEENIHDGIDDDTDHYQ